MPDKAKIDAAMTALNKTHGANSIMRLGTSQRLNVPVIPSGVISIDNALVIGGFARGRVVEIFGPESGGKTTMTLHAIAEAQKGTGKERGVAAFIDAEHALDPVYARKLGVDVENLLVSQPDSGEEALEIAEGLIKCGEIDIVVVDSVAALVPRAELEGDMGDPQMGLQARLMSQAMRKLTGVTSKSKTCLVFINQVREKIGVMFGNPETTTGGRALKFFASQRIEVRKGTLLKESDKVVGCETKVKIVKNKLGPPFREAHPKMLYGQGFDPLHDLIDMAVELNILTKSGTWLSYGTERLGQGCDTACEVLSLNPELASKLLMEVRTKLFKPEAAIK